MQAGMQSGGPHRDEAPQESRSQGLQSQWGGAAGKTPVPQGFAPSPLSSEAAGDRPGGRFSQLSTLWVPPSPVVPPPCSY